ncbi:hypothetical protein RB195_026267 [Necator americanus]
MGAASAESVEIDDKAVEEEQKLKMSLKDEMVTVGAQQKTTDTVTPSTSSLASEKKVDKTTTTVLTFLPDTTTVSSLRSTSTQETTSDTDEGLITSDVPSPSRSSKPPPGISSSYENTTTSRLPLATDVVTLRSESTTRSETNSSTSEPSTSSSLTSVVEQFNSSSQINLTAPISFSTLAPLTKNEEQESDILSLSSSSESSSPTTSPVSTTAVKENSQVVVQHSNDESKTSKENDRTREPLTKGNTTSGAATDTTSEYTTDTLFTESVNATFSMLVSTIAPTTTTLREELPNDEVTTSMIPLNTNFPKKGNNEVVVNELPIKKQATILARPATESPAREVSEEQNSIVLRTDVVEGKQSTRSFISSNVILQKKDDSKTPANVGISTSTTFHTPSTVLVDHTNSETREDTAKYTEPHVDVTTTLRSTLNHPLAQSFAVLITTESPESSQESSSSSTRTSVSSEETEIALDSQSTTTDSVSSPSGSRINLVPRDGTSPESHETSTERTLTTSGASTAIPVTSTFAAFEATESSSDLNGLSQTTAAILNRTAGDFTDEVLAVENATRVPTHTTAESSSALNTYLSSTVEITDGPGTTSSEDFTDSTTISFNVDATTRSSLLITTEPITPTTTSSTSERTETTNEIIDVSATKRMPESKTQTPTSRLATEAVSKGQNLKKKSFEKSSNEFYEAKTLTTTPVKETTMSTETTSTPTEAAKGTHFEEAIGTTEDVLTTHEKHPQVVVAVTEGTNGTSSIFHASDTSIHPHKNLPERWKNLVMRLKTKLEELKAKKGLLSPKKITTTTLPNSEEMMLAGETSNSTPISTVEDTTISATDASTVGTSFISVKVQESNPTRSYTTTPTTTELRSSTNPAQAAKFQETASTLTVPPATMSIDETSVTSSNFAADETPLSNLSQDPKEQNSVKEFKLGKVTTQIITTASTGAIKDEYTRTKTTEVSLTSNIGVEATTSSNEISDVLPQANSSTADSGTETTSTPKTTVSFQLDANIGGTNDAKTSNTHTEDVFTTDTVTTNSDLGANDSSTEVIPALDDNFPFKTEADDELSSQTKTSAYTYTSSAPEITVAVYNSKYTTLEDVTATTSNTGEPQKITDLTTSNQHSDTTTTDSVSNDEDKKSVGGFIVSNSAASSEEAMESKNRTTLQETLREAERSSPPTSTFNETSFTIGQPHRVKTDLLSSLIQGLIGDVTQATTTAVPSANE